MNPFMEFQATVRASCLVAAWSGADIRLPIVGEATHTTQKTKYSDSRFSLKFDRDAADN